MKRKGLLKKGISLLLAASMLLAAGCGGGNGSTESNTTNNSKEEENAEAESQAKGRYLESDLTLPEGMDRVADMKQLEDGSILLLDRSSGLYTSKDNGMTWEKNPNKITNEIGDEPYVSKAAVGYDSRVFFEYVLADAPEDVENVSDVNISYHYGLLDAEGNFKEIQLTGSNNQRIAGGIEFLKDGTILCAFEKSVYKVNTDSGALEEFCTLDKNISQFKVLHDNLLVLTESGAYYFNIETGNEVEDTVLSDFVLEAVSDVQSYSDSSYSILFCEGEQEDTLYTASAKGMFRHVTGGTVMEEVIKQNLSALGDPSVELQSMLMLSNGSFLIAFGEIGGSTLKSYTYDSEVSTVPKNKLTVYSLNDNINIKQAIRDYQKQDTDVYIEYVIGMSGQDGMTREDAIRNLNTEILSGEGPDLLVLDGLPINSYMEKGILEDLSPIFANQLKDKEYFENILNAYKKDDKLYAAPSRFSIPLLVGRAEDIDQVDNLDSYAECVKNLRTKKSSGSLIGAFTEEKVLRNLYDVCAPAWLDETGMLKKEEMVHFLTKAKEVYEAESQIPQADIDRDKENAEYLIEMAASGVLGRSFDDMILNVGSKAMSYLSKEIEIINGKSSGIMSDYDYVMVAAVKKKLGDTTKVKAFHGQSKNVFIPSSIIGLNAQSKSKDAASDFAAFIMSADGERLKTGVGYPVDKKGFESSLEQNESLSTSLSISGSGEDDGEVIQLDLEWPSEEDLNILRDIVNNVSTASITDSNLRDAVLELGPNALNGTKDIESVANEIVNKMQIYLSE